MKNIYFRWYVVYRICITIGMQIKMTVLGYYLYQITGEALSLGLLGLYEAIPRIAFSLPGGYLVEQSDKKKSLLITNIGFFILSILLFVFMNVFEGQPQYIEYSLYTIVFFIGVLATIGSSSALALFSTFIPKNELPKYSAMSSNAWQVGSVIGPILGGIFINQFGSKNSILFISLFLLMGGLAILKLPSAPNPDKRPFSVSDSIVQIKEGLDFVFNNKTLVWAISLDLFAVLFGGCVALLPVFATDVLGVGSVGYGWLRAAMPIGSALALLYFARNPINKNTGRYLIIAVGVFGLGILGFGMSKVFLLSMACLFIMGASDAVSVVIRGAMILIETPENMRARVTSINSIFISSSNELGAFESGFAAQYLGAVRAVIFGGIMTTMFVSLAWWKGKDLKNYEFKDRY